MQEVFVYKRTAAIPRFATVKQILHSKPVYTVSATVGRISKCKSVRACLSHYPAGSRYALHSFIQRRTKCTIKGNCAFNFRRGKQNCYNCAFTSVNRTRSQCPDISTPPRLIFDPHFGLALRRPVPVPGHSPRHPEVPKKNTHQVIIALIV